MSGRFRALERRFGNLRPGLQLVAVEEVALPVTVVLAEVLAQEKKKLPIAEEFVLRFVGAGVDTPAKIAAYLGLEIPHVIDSAAVQLAENHLRRNGEDRLELTEKGKEVVRVLVTTQPVIRELPVAFDRLTWSPANIPERALLEKREAEEAGMTILPASRNAMIGLGDVTPAGMNSLFQDERLQVLRVHRVTSRKHRYLPVQLLVYGDPSRGELELALCVDDDLSSRHGMALQQMRAVEKLGLSIGEAEPRPVLDADLERLRTSEVPGAAAAPQANPRTPAAISNYVATSEVRSIGVFEHADLLSQALDSAQSRLLIMSPWVRGKVVNSTFRTKLQKRLAAGVSVTIAHGIGDDDKGSDLWALESLERIAARFPNFDLARLRNTHAKILIFDDFWINTSFNWLSFKGDPDRTYRMEEGTLVTIPQRVDKEYEGYLRLIDEQRV